MYQKIAQLAGEIKEKAIDIRRDFHKYPETGWLEMRTSAVIAKFLSELGYGVLTGRQVCEEGARIAVPDQNVLEAHSCLVKTQNVPMEYLTPDMEEGFTGVVGILNCGPGPVVALRFDIDALPMEEDKKESHRPYREGFSSVNPGMMHACGHDAHGAIGLATAYILYQIKDQLHGTVKLLFQPGEEGTKGAKAMTAKGHLDNVSFFAGTHVASDQGPDDGDITPASYGSLATCKYLARFKGQPSHAGGFPEQGKSALLAAAHAVVGLSGISRHSEGMTRINVGKINGGTASNVVAEETTIEFEVRGETTKINDYMDQRAKEVCQAAAIMEGCQCDMTLVGQAPSQVSDLDFAERIKSMIETHMPQYRVSSVFNVRNWGSEDIGFMMDRVQENGGKAVYMRTMTTMASPQHTTGFDLDETVIEKGSASFAAIVYDLLK